MQIGVAINTIASQPRVSISSMVSTVVLYHGKQGSNKLLHSRVAKQNIKDWQLQHKKLFLRQLLAHVHYPQNQPTDLREGNQSAIKLSTNIVFHKKLKHIDVTQHFLRDAVLKNEKNIRYVPTQKMAADIFTVGLCELEFKEHRENIMGRIHPNS